MVRMLVATDGSPHAGRAAGMAARLARELREAEVILINVGHIPAIAFGDLAQAGAGLTVLEESLEHAGKAILNEAERTFDTSGSRGPSPKASPPWRSWTRRASTRPT